MTKNAIRILMAEDDPEDQMLVKEAFKRSRVANGMEIVEDGEQLLLYLHKQGAYAHAHRPDLILLDLNMPKKDGREALAEIKADPDLRGIPVIVLTTSSAEEDVVRSYDLGVSSYIEKPVTFEKLVEVVKSLGQYWFQIVKFPPNGGRHTAVTESVHRILLVEDDEEDFLIVRSQLSRVEGHPFELTRVDSLKAALEHFRESDADVVLLDLSLPDSQGSDTFDKIHTTAPGAPLVVLTGLDDETLAVECVKKGAQDYLVKGKTDRDRLARALRYAIERKAAEEALALYKNHLEDLVKRRTAQLKKTNRQLRREISEHEKTETSLMETLARVEENDRAKTEFVSNVSHELRTPLSSMTYAVENMLKGVVGELPARARSYLMMLDEDCRRLAGTVADILDLTRIEAKTLVLNRVKMPFGRFVRETVESLRLQAEEKRLDLSVAAEDGTGFVDCDPRKMERVIINLVNNAIKYTPEKGSICVTLQPGSDGGRFLVLDVIDNGVGIDAKLLSRVTERYFRIGEHVTGTGLGLALCKDLLELHEGRLTLTSPPEGLASGTKASVRLPAASPPVVLVIDDEPAALALLEEQLGRIGYDVRTCATGREALDSLAECRPDVVITDLVLPDVDGTEIIATLKGDASARHIPIIVVTGAEVDRDRRDILESFSVPAIAKPWRTEELMGCMDEVVVGKQYLRR